MKSLAEVDLVVADNSRLYLTCGFGGVCLLSPCMCVDSCAGSLPYCKLLGGVRFAARYIGSHSNETSGSQHTLLHSLGTVRVC